MTTEMLGDKLTMIRSSYALRDVDGTVRQLRLTVIVVLAISFALCHFAARAHAADVEPPEYRTVIDAAVQEYQAQNYPEAREQFRRAHALWPNARTMRGLGLTEYELRNYPEAVRYFEQALASTVRPLVGEVRRDTERVLESARGYVATVRVEVTPSTAYVLVDNQRVEDPASPLMLAVGDHVIEASATGRLSERRVLSSKGGETHVIKISLVESQPSSVAGPTVPLERATRTPLYKRWWLWSAVAVAAGGAVAAVLLLRPHREHEVASSTGNTPLGRGPLYPFAWELER